MHFCRRQSHSQTLQRGRRRWRGRRRRRDGVGRAGWGGPAVLESTRAAVCAARARCAHRTPYGGKQTARGARRQRRSARAARATEGRSSDRWRGRCSVCPGAPSARGARQERGQAWRRGTRGGGGEQPSAPCAVRRPGEGAAGDGAREQPTPGRRFERRLRHACTGAAGRSVVGRGGAGRGPGARRRPRRRLSARRGAPLSGPRVQASGTMSKPQVVHSTSGHRLLRPRALGSTQGGEARVFFYLSGPPGPVLMEVRQK